jgi:hypothetical protein
MIVLETHLSKRESPEPSGCLRCVKGSLKNAPLRWEQKSYVCNPSYSGDRDQEDHGLKPAQGNSSRDPILKKSHHKKGLVMWLKVKALSSNKQTNKNTINP